MLLYAGLWLSSGLGLIHGQIVLVLLNPASEGTLSMGCRCRLVPMTWSGVASGKISLHFTFPLPCRLQQQSLLSGLKVCIEVEIWLRLGQRCHRNRICGHRLSTMAEYQMDATSR